MTTTDQTPQYDLELNVDEGRYYPPQSEVGPDGQGGIVDLDVSHVGATDEVNVGLTTLSFEGSRDDEPFSYEFDLDPDTAQRLARQLLEAAGRSGSPR